MMEKITAFAARAIAAVTAEAKRATLFALGLLIGIPLVGGYVACALRPVKALAGTFDALQASTDAVLNDTFNFFWHYVWMIGLFLIEAAAVVAVIAALVALVVLAIGWAFHRKGGAPSKPKQ